MDWGDGGKKEAEKLGRWEDGGKREAGKIREWESV
jgi:hypothetical protein